MTGLGDRASLPESIWTVKFQQKQKSGHCAEKRSCLRNSLSILYTLWSRPVPSVPSRSARRQLVAGRPARLPQNPTRRKDSDSAREISKSEIEPGPMEHDITPLFPTGPCKWGGRGQRIITLRGACMRAMHLTPVSHDNHLAHRTIKSLTPPISLLLSLPSYYPHSQKNYQASHATHHTTPLPSTIYCTAHSNRNHAGSLFSRTKFSIWPFSRLDNRPNLCAAA